MNGDKPMNGDGYCSCEPTESETSDDEDEKTGNPASSSTGLEKEVEPNVSCMHFLNVYICLLSCVGSFANKWITKATPAPPGCDKWIAAAAAMGPPEQKKRGRKPKKPDAEKEGMNGKEKAKKSEKTKVSAKSKATPKAKAKAKALAEPVPKAEPKPKAKRVLSDEQKRINSLRSGAYHKAQRDARREGCDPEEVKRRAREVQDSTRLSCMHSCTAVPYIT